MMKEMIRNFDQSILTKAGKVDFFELKTLLEQKVAAEEVKASEDKMEEKIENFRGDIGQLDKKLGIIQTSMSQGIYEAVKKANAQIQKSLEKKMVGMSGRESALSISPSRADNLSKKGGKKNG